MIYRNKNQNASRILIRAETSFRSMNYHLDEKGAGNKKSATVETEMSF